VKSWNGLPAPSWRGGRFIEASVSSVTGSFSMSTGRSSPTQTVTIRPCESNVTVAQSRTSKTSRRVVPRPSGPGPV
jgi:hypothetical protein